MPAFYRRFYNPNWRRRWRWRRRRNRTWRPRKTVFRRIRRRRRVRRRFYRHFKTRKLKRITVKQWQPPNIRKSTIKGNLLLLACGQTRINNNSTLYNESIIPIGESGGGGWSILQLTLTALFDEYLHYRNKWTVSNNGLPLVKYTGCKIKFYRSAQTDYIVVPVLSPPFSVTEEIYMNTQPSRMLLTKNKIIVPRLDRPWTKKPYVTRKFRPPSLFQSKWYFQQDITKIPFIVLHSTACSFDEMYQPENQLSYNLTLTSLNTDYFQNSNFLTGKYFPKTDPNTPTKLIALFTPVDGNPFTNSVPYKKLIPMIQVKNYIDSHQHTEFSSYNNFELAQQNPFTHHIQDQQIPTYTTYYPTTSDQYSQNTTPTLFTEFYWQLRYNPFRDKGTGNIVYFKNLAQTQTTFQNEPQDERLIVRNYPLWLIMWSCYDWQKKLNVIHHMDQDYCIVIKSPYITPQRSCYVLLDNYFTSPQENKLTQTDKANWHPKLEYQREQMFYLAQSGPASPKITKTKSIECHCNYSFYCKFGGSPAPMETITDPSTQEKFPTPSNIFQGLQVQDPKTAKEYYLSTWDERDGQITATCAKRIKTQQSPTKYFTDYSKDIPVKETTPSPTESEEESEASTPERKLYKLKQHNRLLKHKLQRILKTKKLSL
nr:MAG: ORF1 [TTV-like mini virus]